MSIKSYSDSELEAELARRKTKAAVANKPKLLDEPNLLQLRVLCQEYIDALAGPEHYVDDDMSHYIFEEAMAAFFGKNIWQWINAQQPKRGGA